MNFDSFVLAAVASELNRGAFIDQVYQPDDLTVALALSGRGERRLWLFSADARHARAHLIPAAARPPSPASPPGFCMLLRKHLRGARLVEADQPRFDRVLRLRVTRGDGERLLIHEIMGRHSNLALADGAGVVLGVLKQVSPEQSRVRRLVVHKPYVLPPGERLDPREADEAACRAALGEAPVFPEQLVKAFSGFGPFAAREVLARAEQPIPEAIWPVLRELVEALQRGEFEPTLLLDERGQPVDAWAFHARQWPEDRQQRAETMSAAVAATLHRAAAEETVEAHRRAIRVPLARALAAARERWEEARRQIEVRSRAGELRIQGDLLAAAPEAGRGATEALVPDFYAADGAPRRIPLDPLLTRQENAAAYFRRYRRAMAAAAAAAARLPLLEEQIADLEARLAAVDAAAPEALEEIAPPGKPARAAPRPKERPLPAGIRIRRVDVDGWEVLLGENAASNDYLITRLARPDDLWLHARAVNGAHVVVRGARSADRVPPAVLREAARLAATHSDARHASLVLVDFTLRRYVRKPRGAAPGRVTYQREKTIPVERHKDGRA
ncbi:MAG: NFACT family protein [Armatimonadetes bacterium]|nr:NFACT family protein [Armatimonadota bacterium]